jgi:hypothetical protein
LPPSSSPTMVGLEVLVAWPDRLTINASTGGARGVSGELSEYAPTWGLTRRVSTLRKTLLPEKVDPANWRHPDVGWGLVLPDNDTIPRGDRARATDAPDPIRELLAARKGAPVLRYRPDLGTTYLRRYSDDGDPDDVPVSGSRKGIATGCIPRFLLICGGPSEVPWELQFQLNTGYAVGRLDLTGEALDNYVSALRSNWDSGAARYDRAVIWATDLGEDDISHLMRDSIAAEVAAVLAADPDVGAGVRFVDGSEQEASCEALTQALASTSPALVVTTSHGLTAPVNEKEIMARQLGVPVDQLGSGLDPRRLQQDWNPGGAIWYAHACCSAGAAGQSRFDELAELAAPKSGLAETLRGIADLGSKIAPLPQLLLGAPNPLRAFVGHVEPTFDWTLQDPETGHVLTASIRDALYSRLYLGEPIGWALRECFGQVGQLLSQWSHAVAAVNAENDARDRACAFLLTALDRQSMVLLGDPTVRLPLPNY